MNCDDMLMAVERKRMKKKVEQIERKKDTINRHNAIVENALSIIAKGGPDKLPEYKTCIMWKMKIEKKAESFGRKVGTNMQTHACTR